MSNVLKNINDCYNFTEESNDSKAKTKRRPRLTSNSSAKPKPAGHVSKTSAKVADKRDKRCPLFKETLAAAVWLNDIRADSRSSIESVIEKLSDHLASNCKCVNICSIYLLIGNTYFENYLFNQSEFESRIVAEENKTSEAKAAKESDNSTERVINDIPVNKESKLEGIVFAQLVNHKNLSAILAPLEKAVDNWSQALDLSLDLNMITEETIVGFKIYYNLSSVIQIYTLHNQIENRLKAAQILHNFCRYYGSKSSEISLTANYYLVKTYIEMGAVSRANRCLTRLPSTSNAEQEMPQTFAKSLNMLAKCELDLLSGRPRKAGKLLKSFLDSDYLQKLTINRYYVKGLTLLIATKFASNDLDFSDCFREFLEPTQMALAILKRWHSWLSTSKSNNENQMLNTGDLDPLWYKYGVMNFAFDAMQMSALFYAQIEMPVDSIYYYNALIKLARRFCATYRLASLLTVGSQLDAICDYKHSAEIKLDNALLCLKSSRLASNSISVFSSTESPISLSPEVKIVSDSEKNKIETRYQRQKSDSDLEIIEVFDRACDHFDPHECNHTKDLNLWDLKKKLRPKTYNIDTDSDDSVEEIKRNRCQLTLDSQMIAKDNIDAFIMKLQIDFYRLLLNETNPKYALNQIKDFHNKSMQSFAKTLSNKFENLLKDENSEEMLQNYSYYKTIELKILESIAALQVELKDFEEAIKTCNQISSSSLTYEQRVLTSNLLYLEAYSRFQLYVSNNDKIDGLKLWTEYDLNSTISALDNSCPQSTTPTRSQNKPLLAPNAPKGKQEYASDEIKDYVTALEKCHYEELIQKRWGDGDSNASSKGRQNSKSIFDNDSQLRSIPPNESNSTPNDNPLTGHPMTSKIVKTSNMNERVTRSRGNLRSLEDMLESKPKIESRSKRSIKKSKEMSIDDTAEDVRDFNVDIDQLDEVFDQMLTISGTEFEKNADKTTENENSLEYIKRILNDSFKLISSHPPSKLYRDIHKLLLEIYSLSDKLREDLIGYHFSESIRSTYRYRYMFINERKKRINKTSKYESNPFVFDAKDIEPINSCLKLIRGLPNDWRVIQMMTVDNNTMIPDLMICRYQNGKRPVFLKIKTDPQKIIKHFMTQFNDIIEKSNASIVNKDRETFWRLRYSLDEELMFLLRSVDETWFGPFKGILFGQLQSTSYQRMCSQLKSYAMGFAEKQLLTCMSEPLLEVMIESLPALKYTEYRTAMHVIFNSPPEKMITKVFNKYDQMITDIYPIDNKESIFTTYELSPVGLILDKSLESFPFESLPSLNSFNQPIFRTPSLRMLSLMYSTFRRGLVTRGVDDSKVYYVVNPADNLAKTEDFFKESFTAMTQWEGVIGKSPEPQDLKKAFDSKDAYIFFGHGAGSSYYRLIPEGLDGCNVNCASIVIGCSSGKLFSDGKQLETYGASYRFLLNGCPSYVGVLWDVTDKDIDKFSDQMLSYWFLNWKPEINETKQSMANTKAVSKARIACRLKHLIGAAPVVYGLPLVTKSQL